MVPGRIKSRAREGWQLMTGSNILTFPTGTKNAGPQSAQSVIHPLCAPPGRSAIPVASGHPFCAAPSTPFIDPPDGECLAHPRPRSTTPRSGILFSIGAREALNELLTALVILALLVPWFVGVAASLRWLWVHAP